MIKDVLKIGNGQLLRIVWFRDHKSLYNTIYSKKKTVTNKFLLIDISIIREIIDNNEVHKIKWVESRHQISDCLTKYGVSSSNLLTVLKGQKLLNHLH